MIVLMLRREKSGLRLRGKISEHVSEGNLGYTDILWVFQFRLRVEGLRSGVVLPLCLCQLVVMF